MLLRKLMDIEGAAAKTVYPQIGRIFTDRFGSPRGNVYHNGNSQGGRRGEGGRDFNEQRTTLALCFLNREPLLEFTPCAPGCSMVVGRPPPLPLPPLWFKNGRYGFAFLRHFAVNSRCSSRVGISAVDPRNAARPPRQLNGMEIRSCVHPLW